MDETLDTDACAELLLDLVLVEGQKVAEQRWDSGAPGAGAGTISVYKFRGHYFGVDDVSCHGPFEELSEAIRATGLDVVTDATEEIVIEGKIVHQRDLAH